MKVYFPIVKLYIRYLLKACFGLFSLSLAEKLEHNAFSFDTSSVLSNEFA